MHASEDTRRWLRRYYDAIDANRSADLADFYAADARVRFANNPPVAWHELGQQFRSVVRGAVAGVRHEISTVFEDGNRLAYELLVTYVRRDGTSVTLPGSVFCRIENGRFAEQHMYVDLSPVLA